MRMTRLRASMVVFACALLAIELSVNVPPPVRGDGGFTVTLRVGDQEVAAPAGPLGANGLCLKFDGSGQIVGGTWTSNGVGIAPLEHPNGTAVTGEHPAAGARMGQSGKMGSGSPVPRPANWTQLCITFDIETGRIIGGTWKTVGVLPPRDELGPLLGPDGKPVTGGEPLDTLRIGNYDGKFVSETGREPGALPKKIVIPGVAGDSSTGSPPAVDPPPSGGGNAPVIKSIGCATPVKVGQASFCQSVVEAGSSGDPLTLRYWEALEGNPASSTQGSSFVTTFAAVGTKQVTLTACSGGGCSAAATTVLVEPSGPQPLTGSGTFTLFEQSGQCEGLTIAEVLQLSLSLTPSGTSVTVNVTNKGWLGTFGTWTDEPGGKLLSATGQNLSNPPAGVTAYHFSIAGHYNTTTKVLAWETASGFSLFYDRPGDQRCIARYSYNIQLN